MMSTSLDTPGFLKRVAFPEKKATASTANETVQLCFTC